ncbi:MAG: alanine racemase [Roseburia sp.]|nr:alanine racemase [Roseburia sp.]
MDSKIHCGRVWAEVDLDAVLYNVEAVRQRLRPDTRIMAVIKTDGYGHGALPIAERLERKDCIWGYAVATAEEALELRRGGIRKSILILGYTFPEDFEELIREEVCLTVYLYDTARLLSDRAIEVGKRCRVHIKVDTGMGRIGLSPDKEGLAQVKALTALPGLETEGIFTHFATADEADKSKAYAQLETFRRFADAAERETGRAIPIRHCANSAAIAEMPEACMDVVRAGIILYGLWPSAEVERAGHIRLEPALSLKSRIVYVKTVPQNREIGYGGTFTTARETRVATVCLGYGDGYPRSLSNTGDVLVNGQRAPILGRVCMDQLMIDVTDVSGAVNVGDTVTLIGRDGEETITMEQLGELSGRFNYELACDIGKRVPRIHK